MLKPRIPTKMLDAYRVRRLDDGIGVPLVKGVPPFQLVDFPAVVIVDETEELHHGSFELSAHPKPA